MNIFRKKYRRAPWLSVLLTLLLAAGAAFSLTGVSAYFSARAQCEAINSNYTTIALPYDEAHFGYMPMQMGGLFVQELPLYEALDASGLDIQYDRRVLLGAYVEGTRSILYPDRRDIHDLPESTYCPAVFAVRCEAVERTYTEAGSELFDADGTSLGYEPRRQIFDICTMSVEKTLFVNADLALPPLRTLTVHLIECHEDGSPLFEVGKTYLIRGLYAGADAFYFSDGEVISAREFQEKGDLHFFTLPTEGLPFYCEYSGDVDAFLASEAGAQWREEVLPAMEKNCSAIRLLLTDCVQSLYHFNTGDAMILQGRDITQAEYDSGAAVCLISTDYAAQNNLFVGDTLHMALYQPPIAASRAIPEDGAGSVMEDITGIEMNLCLPDNYLQDKSYEVIGIYSAPSISYGTFALRSDTILAPKASVPDAMQQTSAMDGLEFPSLTSIILRNGTSAELEAYMESQGLGGYLLYFDQGYGTVSDAAKTTLQNALRMMLVGAGAFGLTAVLYLFFWNSAMKKSVSTAHAIGISRKALRKQRLAALLPMLALALLLGTAAGVILFRQVCAGILSTELALSWNGVGICTLAQILLLLLGAILSGYRAQSLTKRR